MLEVGSTEATQNIERLDGHTGFMAGVIAIAILTIAMPMSAQTWRDVFYEFEGVGFHGAMESDSGTILLFGNQGTVARLDPVANELTQLRGSAGLPWITCGAQWQGDTLIAFQGSGGTLISTDQGASWSIDDIGIEGIVVDCLRRLDGSLVIVSETFIAMLHTDGTREVFDVSADDIHETSDGILISVDRDGRVLTFNEANRDWDEVANLGAPVLGITSLGSTAWMLTHRALYSADIADGDWTLDKMDYQAYATGDITCIDDTLLISRTDGLSMYQYLSADFGATWFGGWTGPQEYGDHRFVEVRSGLVMVGPYGMYRYARQGRLYDSTTFERNGIGIGRRPILQKFFTHLTLGPANTWYAIYRSPGYGLMKSLETGSWETVMQHNAEVIERYKDLTTADDVVCVLVDSVFSYQIDSAWQNGQRWKVYLFDKDDQQIVVRSDSILESAEGIASGGRYLFIYGGRQLLRLHLDDLTLDTLSIDDPGYIRSMHSNSRGRTAYVGKQIGISDDVGDTWTYSDHPVAESAGGSIHVTDDGRLYLARLTRDGNQLGINLYRSEPPYSEWTTTVALPPKPGLVSPYSIDANESGIVAIASRSGQVAISTDSGTTWDISRPYPESFAELPAVVVTESGIIRVAGSPSHIIETSRTVAGVREWVEYGSSSCEAKWKDNAIEVSPLDNGAALFEVVDLGGNVIARGAAELTGSVLKCRLRNDIAPGVYFVGVAQGEESTWCKMLITD